MLAVSKANAYSFVAIHTVDRNRHQNTGEDVRRGVQLDFRPFGLPQWAKDQAKEQMGYPKGIGHDEDPSQWFGMFDTEVGAKIYGWTPEEKAKVEERLLTSNSNGVEYVIVEKPRRKPPWPTYDKFRTQGKRTPDLVAETIAAKVAEDGYEPEEVLQYEIENACRPEVISALQALISPPVPEEELVEA